ncbi:N-methylhydantoinase A/acetone carboxylase, beta subunit [SAR116 cluster alpha proteobacterium HIMB100]|nr:N-methylhydantoinase A/acetone carboxylase, beta subunit [SAR116 cluster alpha proteobacterium HIMB100]
MNQNATRVGVDIGGTFTDVALETQEGLFTAKVLTDYQEPEHAILMGIEEAAERAKINLRSIEQVIHGTTLVTNSLIERRGAKLAFITTEGFRDVIEMRSENRFEQYDLNLELPKPLVARKDRYTINERIGPDGEILLSASDKEINELAAKIVAEKYEAVAIGFLHAYANDVHEIKMEQALRALLPHLSISISSVISPQMRELPRFNTVIANAYVQPQVASYLGRLVDKLRNASIPAPIFLLHSGGGLISVETATEQPVRLLESGPAGGAIFAANYANAHKLKKVLSFDMGGTTAKICLIEDSEPKTANLFEIARTYRFKKGSGMTVSTPVVEMVEIGAGGGSIASIDDMGRIQVGPQSAGSEPGPACYQLGGSEPTVTDANLKLGRLDPDNFAGGSIPLSLIASQRVLSERLGSKINISSEEAAFGVTEIVDENMANAARVHTVENGRDIEHFTMIAFGGGAPLHACRLCEKLNIKTLLIPPGAGVGSAIGFLRAPFSYEASKGLFQQLDNFNLLRVNQTLNSLKEEAIAFVDQGAPHGVRNVKLTAFMRYSGQGWEIPVLLDYREFTAEDVDSIKAKFEQSYETLFGRTIKGLPIEITNWSLSVSSPKAKHKMVSRHDGGNLVKGGPVRHFYDAARRQEVEAQEVRREEIKPGAKIIGPAVIVEEETSTIVTSSFCAIGQSDGSLLLAAKDI